MRTVYSFVLSFLILISWFVTEGFARSDWEVKPALFLSQSYDDNIYSREDNVEDFITRVGTDLSAIYSGVNVSMLTNYSGTFNAYADHSELNVLTHQGRINADFGRWLQRYSRDSDFTISENFIWTPEIRDLYFDEARGEMDPLGSLGLRSRRSDLYRNVFSIEFGHPLSKRQDITVKYSNLLTLYSDPDLIDNETDIILIGTDLEVSNKDAVYGNIGASRMNIGREYSTSYSITGGLRRTITPLFLLNANAGIETIEYEAGNSTSDMRAGLQFSRTARYTTFNAGYSRALNSASGVSTIPTRVDLFYTNVGMRHSSNLSTNFGANYSVNQSTRGSEIDASSYNLSAKVSYRFKPWLDGNVSVSHFNQSYETPVSPVTLSEIEVHRNLVIIQLTFYPHSYTWK